jgi:hypothetical protein
MSFNVNFLGGIPYNPDNLHIPINDAKGIPNSFPSPFSTRILGYSFKQMFTAYWTVRSFEIDVNAAVIDNTDPLSEFLNSGGGRDGIFGAIIGLNSLSSARDGITIANGHTKIYSKYSKRVRKAREGIFNNITQPNFNDLGSEALDLDEEINPNKLVSHFYGTNEGTLCSAGPVHIFNKNNVNIIIDFSDIKYYTSGRSRFYWPNVTINVSVPNAGANFGNTIPPRIISGGIGGVGGGISNISLNVNGVSVNLGSSRINSQISTRQIANVNINIKPGKRCCDRFLWDGKDQERKEDSETKTPREDSKNTCKDVCGDDDLNGVYSKIVQK